VFSYNKAITVGGAWWKPQLACFENLLLSTSKRKNKKKKLNFVIEVLSYYLSRNL